MSVFNFCHGTVSFRSSRDLVDVAIVDDVHIAAVLGIDSGIIHFTVIRNRQTVSGAIRMSVNILLDQRSFANNHANYASIL